MTDNLETTFRTGGPPERLVGFGSAAAYLDGRSELGVHRVVGGGSNLLVADGGPAGTIAVLSSPSSGLLDLDGTRARLDAAGNWHETALDLADRGLAGVESLVGIPGTVGGAIVQNIGAYGHEICEVVERVEVASVLDGSQAALTPDECKFAYRDSRFKSADRGRYVVLAVVVQLERNRLHVPAYDELARELADRTSGAADGYELHDVHQAVLGLRSGKNMVWDRTDTRTWGAGSFFVNPTVTAIELASLVERLGDLPAWPVDRVTHKVSAGWLVERAGFRRGHAWSTVALADGHALGLVNRSGTATTAEVLDAANEVARAVTRLSGLRLLAEPVLFGFDPDLRLDFDAHIEP